MRNLFDQYSVPENRLTHALACCLDHDPKLARQFLKHFAPHLPLHNHAPIRIVQQQIPGQLAPDEDDARGLPDAWLYSPEQDWSLLIESKVAAAVSIDQLKRHLKTAERAGFKPVSLLLLSTEPFDGPLPPGATHRSWSEIYEWFNARAASSFWAEALVDYLRAVERRFVDEEYLMAGTLTKFDGFHFTQDRPYTAREGRRLIGLLRPQLLKHPSIAHLIDPKSGRPAITGRGADPVWDFLSVKTARSHSLHTLFPHFTYAIHNDHLEAALTLPNGLHTDIRKRLLNLGDEGFTDVVRNVLRRLDPLAKRFAATPRARVVQRHFLSQKSAGKTDALLDFDLRTAFKSNDSRVKRQPEWLSTAYSVLQHRRSNLQMQLWLRIPYSDGITDRASITEAFVQTWLATRPLLDAILP